MPFCSFGSQADENRSLESTGGGWNVAEVATSNNEELSPYSSSTSWSFQSPESYTDKERAARETQTYIADALQNMSLQDREKIYHEVHGVEEVVEETPDFLERSFAALKEELNSLVLAHEGNMPKSSRSNTSCAALARAQQLDHDYVHSPFIYKAFLRSERFDVKAAAIRMVGWFEMKAWCFGVLHPNDDKYLCQDITQAMLTPGDIESIRKGCNQVLPRRDRSGRCVYLNLPHLSHFESQESLGRMYMYDSWSMTQDEDTQRRGVALVCFEAGDHERPLFDMALVPVACRGLMTSPVKYIVLHHCYSDQRFKFITRMGLKLLPRDFRARNKLHFGTPIECFYTLMGFGISDDILPFNVHGELRLKQHHDHWQMRATQERMILEGKLRPLSQIQHNEEDVYCPQSESSIVVVPSLMDVLMGRGTKVHSHHGNAELHRMVDAAVPEYYEESGTHRAQKTSISQRIVQELKQDIGGRFLKQDPESGVWQVADDEAARLKVSHLFRARRDGVLRDLARRKKKEQASMVAKETKCANFNHASKRAKFDEE